MENGASHLPSAKLRESTPGRGAQGNEARRNRLWLAGIVVGLALVLLWPILVREWTVGTGAAEGGGPVSFWGVLGKDLALAVGWVPALIAAVWLAVRPFRALTLLLFLCAASADFFEGFYIQAPFMKVYAPDILIALALAGTAGRWLAHRESRRFPRMPLTLPLAVFCVAGIGFLAVGLAHSISLDRAFGDFRRSFFYAGVFFLTAWESALEPRRAAWMGGGFVAGVCVQIVTGFLSVVSHRFYQMHFADVFHILSHLSTTVLSGVFYLGLAAFLTRRSPREFRWAVWAVASVVLLVVFANFRAAWLGLAAGTAVCLLRLPGAALRVRRFVLPVLAALVIFAVLFQILGNVEIAPGTTLRTEIENKVLYFMDFRNDPNVRWRIESYRRALKAWAEHPVVGQGLGYVHEFYAGARTPGAPSYLATGHRVHNSYLWFLAATGAIGTALFAWVQLTLLRAGWRGAGGGCDGRRIELAQTGAETVERASSGSGGHRLLYLALLGFQVHFLTVTGFHHLFESIVPVVVLYGLAGIVSGRNAMKG